ncbi:MFS transporter [Desulfurispira natronophila]|uniref:DHA2 family metal-tetracycline-proton antiporter-like MFS transporter n=1 Tax=Desulfurispira natronophila TaxID=682562 RepID=A0A7W7Y4E3_9BACT|nr:MFS transporter [Desulfurispira natronophila]MBB5021829.1 DHA2 family metal-tetracycline-proton antiporter-like MFS transporter [Desulfurispira natronophila]
MSLDENLVKLRLVPLLSMTIFISVLNGVMFNVAIPDIAAHYHISPGLVSWVITAYVVIFAFGSVVYVRLADRFAIRNIITFGLTLFCIGSLLGFFSSSFAMLIVARVVQAAGASGVPALGMLLATVYVPHHLRGATLGVIASTVALSSGVGPIVGGFLAGSFDWNYLFLVPLLLLPIMPLLRHYLPLDEAQQKKPFDLRGALYLCVAVASLLTALTQFLWLFLAPAILSALLFRWHIRRAPFPFISTQLLQRPAYRGTIAAVFLVMSTVFGMLFAMPMLLRHLHDLPTFSIGIFLFPAAMCAALAGWLFGKIADRRGPTFVVAAGHGALMLGFSLLAITAGTSALISAACLVIAHSGFAMVHSSLAASVSNTLPRELTGMGMGVFNLVFFISGAFGTALTGITLEQLQVSSHQSFSILFGGLTVVAMLALFVFSRACRQGSC